MKLPTLGEISFSLKTFAAAMLALYIAFSMDLQRPFWAMLTVYIVANPFSGAVRSKAIYRVIGTLLGSAITLLLVPNLVNAPELLLLALALWIGLCIYISLLDRTPRSYLFLLAGYTCALIGLPSVSNPIGIFDVALARVEEITLGIVCATLIHSLIFPVPVAPSLFARIDGALKKARAWSVNGLNRQEDTEEDRRGLSATLSELRILATHLPFDTSRLSWASGLVNGLCDQLALMLPLLYAIEDRLHTLGELPDGWQNLLTKIASWIEAGADPSQTAALQEELAALTPAPQQDWQAILLINLAARVNALILAWTHSAIIRQGMNQSSSVLSAELTEILSQTAGRSLYFDRGIALRSAATAAIAILLSGAFWIASAWPSGVMAPVMAAVACSLFATLDNPAPAIKATFILTVATIPVSAFYLLVALPAAGSFPMLALTMFPTFLLLGVFMMRPQSAFPALMVTLIVASTLALQDTAMADINSFLNNKVGELSGIACALFVTSLMRSFSSEWVANRLLRAGWRDLAKLISYPAEALPPTFTGRMIDRLGLLAPRLASADNPQLANGVINDLRIGHEMMVLIRHQQLLPQLIQPLLAKLTHYFSHCPLPASPDLLHDLDQSLAGAIADSQPQLIAAMVGIRRDLFPDAAPWKKPLNENL